ncbi:WW domain-containing protein [Cordyceps javanica]|uniref:WW domain-containing protein n=1 Tax=Cordyceps javanica TaxID=43265 RepID=A0A545VW66_9HYPO|nr:WW domain-containing protein [Cordyceps javanica]TQW05963.1 WW domain-containing protein [Cordyceps javanica]
MASSPAPESQAEDSDLATQQQINAAPRAHESASSAKPDDDPPVDAEATALGEEQDTKDETKAEDPATGADLEDGEVEADTAPPLPNEPTPGGPPLPSEPVPEDDGWDCQFDSNTQAWFFHNRFTGKTQWDNPRVPTTAPGTAAAPPPAHEKPAAGGYNPAIHGDYDPNAWYAKGAQDDDEQGADGPGGLSAAAAADLYAATATFNRYSGGFQSEDAGPGRHSDESKARRQMNAYFDADAASAAHDGRSLKAERQNKKPSKAEVKAFKEKRRARKEEKRRAWLRD